MDRQKHFESHSKNCSSYMKLAAKRMYCMYGWTNVYLPFDLYDAGCTVIAIPESKVEERSTCWISPGNWSKDNDDFNEIRAKSE